MVFEFLTKPLKPIMRFFVSRLSNHMDTLSYAIFHLLSYVKIIKLADAPSPTKDTDRAKCMWQSATERNIKVFEIWALGRPINVFLAKLPNGKKMIFEGLPRPGADSPSLEWMDDKAIMKEKFRRAGFPVPKGEACITLNCAKKAFNEIVKNGGMAVVKPTLGSRSRHTKIHIKTLKDLDSAFKIAKQISLLVSIEEELPGPVYRVVLIGGKVGGILRRDPPIVVGDGRMTIQELVMNANRDPRRHGHIFHEIPINFEFEEALKAENLTKNSVPESGREVIVGTKIGRSQGGTNTDVTDELHLENRKLFTDIARFLGDPLVGIDFIIKDISKPWRSQLPCGTIELNSVPFLDLHIYPFEGKVRNLSAMLWNEVLAKENNL